MTAHRSTTGIKIVLTFIALVGLGLNFFIVLDADNGYFGVIKPRAAAAEPADKPGVQPPPSKEVVAYAEVAKKSILLIYSESCNDSSRANQGTGFVIKSGYVATNAHVVKEAVDCGKQIFAKDSVGSAPYKLVLVGIPAGGSELNDIAILAFEDKSVSLPPLDLADSDDYTNGHMGDKVFTLGYGNINHITPESPAMSGVGTLSQFDSTKNMFVTENMSLKPGNSGGPLLLESDRKVLGLVYSRFNDFYIAATSMIIPINHVKRFFREKTNVAL